MKKNYLTTLAILLSGIYSVSAQQINSSYKISKINIEGNGSWDYIAVDENTNRLFVSHGTVVNVVDTKDKKVVGIIEDTKGVHGITLAENLNKGYVSNGKDTSVTIFNLKTLKLIAKVKVTGLNPDAILFDNFSQKVFVFNGRTNNATVIDANTDKVISTISLSGKPEFSVSNNNGLVFVNIENKNEIAVINSKTFAIENTWSILPGDEPTGLAIDNKTHRLFSVCGNKLMVVTDAQNGKVITTLPIGDHCDGLVFDAQSKNIFTSNGEGTITVINEENENTFKVLETITTQKGAKTIALNNNTHQLFLSVAEYGEIPPVTEEHPKPKALIKPNTFGVLVVEKK
ncbi:MAG: YncE family protein [Bacteroidota bacterium]